jgi:SAM-dependent methyltransferase
MSASTLTVESAVEQFESIYREAHGDAALIPWADGRAQPALVNWLNAVAPSIIRCGARVCVVGCGLGDDARELMTRGYDVTAFDCSQTAIEWAKRLDPDNARCYFVADLFNLPSRWMHRFDLVVEINTIQSLPPEMHKSSVAAIARLLSPHGNLLVICRGGAEPVSTDDGPPWALTEDELLRAVAAAGLNPAAPLAIFNDDEDPPVRRMRGLFKRM